MAKSTNIETIAIHGSMKNNAPANDTIVPGIELSTIYEHRNGAHTAGDYNYTRLSNPNREQLETVLAQLEEGEAALAFASGVAAITAALQSAGAGAHVLVPGDVYYGTMRIVWEFAEAWNMEIDFIDMTDLDQVKASIKPNTKMIWVETPSNPRMLITDVVSISKIAKEAGATVVIDNTWPSPLNMQPLKLGADIVIHSTTKYLSGHSDILGGAVIVKEKNAQFDRIKSIQVSQGAVPSPFDCWLLSRSIRSFPYRMRAHNENAVKLAEFLNTHPKVKTVYFPGLKDHPGHEIAIEQMSGFGGMISFLIDGGYEEAKKIVGASKMIKAATSLGGIESIWEHRKSSEGDKSPTPDNLIRLSVGLEHPDDLIADLDQALSNAG